VLNNILAKSASDEDVNLDNLLHETVVKAKDEQRGMIVIDI